MRSAQFVAVGFASFVLVACVGCGSAKSQDELARLYELNRDAFALLGDVAGAARGQRTCDECQRIAQERLGARVAWTSEGTLYVYTLVRRGFLAQHLQGFCYSPGRLEADAGEVTIEGNGGRRRVVTPLGDGWYSFVH